MKTKKSKEKQGEHGSAKNPYKYIAKQNTVLVYQNTVLVKVLVQNTVLV